ncbi:MAG TPA: Asp-tRNA(Asn)/Glu-tRNA(Gln) amidotransferase subunit GatA [Anaerohalosphaeraceae bacterium]|nr:Asp-tRNA(Asn)/Glu-tRNA(Gln) amidotransferase subunit GatA [Anaerohalosphaeraceae bacterium]HOL89951.1 Asp-tRNA(Asn)/Glu-tRNA(Gln) amidotransferase subunit GatA [Anaerohalosphaeraceae bacterium]HPP56323.1 Asp-tRNA(Asn)/Glu-tRNA(Gln) amidotransferase subunit GatA [Anaerohalosphaeraceae bacterium]
MEWTVRSIRDRVASGKLQSREAVERFFARIEKIEPQVGAFLTLLKETALEQAAKVDEKIASGRPLGPLAGVPVAVKDNLCTTFGPTTCASRMLENFISPYNAHVIEKLLAADAVIVGKTNMDEFAMGSSTENSGLKKTCNPWDISRVPGGSSGGSAAAVAARMCAAALGSDTGGSIRQPAGFCGVVGLKPTYGRVSRYGLVAYGSSLDQIGPITQTVEDAAVLLNVIAGHDPRDSTCVSEQTAPVPDYTAGLETPLEGLRIAVVESFLEGIQAEVQQAIEEALRLYQKLGARLVPIQMPHFEYAVSAYYVIATAEASSNLARYDGVHYGYRSPRAGSYIEVYSKSRDEALGAEVKRRIMLGTFALSSGYYDAYYLKALKVRNLIRNDFTRAFEQADCLMMPVSPTTAFRFGEKTADPLQMYLADIYTIAVNLAGVPAVSIPCGLDRQNLPIGLQIVTAPFTESMLLRIARMFEKSTQWHSCMPDIAK